MIAVSFALPYLVILIAGLLWLGIARRRAQKKHAGLASYAANTAGLRVLR